MSFGLNWQDFTEAADNDDFVKKHILGEVTEKSIYNNKSKVFHTFIEGENYLSLKLIEEKYKEKINIIYIDPPYNTGKKFIYNDISGTREDRHSKWLSFMERRLKMAKKLLSNDGCIFISIGQEELYHLKLLCDSIFGSENFINNFMWLHGKGKKDRWSRTMEQSNLCYCKNKKFLKPFAEFITSDWAKTNIDGDIRGNWFSGSISFTEKRSNKNHKNYFEIKSPSGKRWQRQWLVSKEEMTALINENKIYWGLAPDYSQVPRIKIFNKEMSKVIPKNILEKLDSTRRAQKHVDNLLGIKNSFDNPKPVSLIQRLISITNMPSDITVMDFFAGSGTTLEAVSEMNKKDGGSRKAVLIQLPEKIGSGHKFTDIAALCYTRIAKVLARTEENVFYIGVFFKALS